MRIAITFEKESGNVFQHFGHTEFFKVYDIKEGKIAASSIVDTGGNAHGALVEILKRSSVDKLICGGIGSGAKCALAEAGIEFYGGVSGNADEQVETFLHGELKHDSNAECDHNGEHDNGHNCGEQHSHCGKHC